MSSPALSASFEYLCYGSTAILTVFILTVRGVFASMFSYNIVGVLAHVGAGALVQQFKLFAWKGGVRGFEPQSGLQVSKKENVSSPLT